MEQQLITVAEAARRLSLSIRTVFGLVARGKLTPYRFGRRATRLDAAEVQKLIESARQGSRR